MGFLLAADQSVVWRGPMLMTALQQMLRQVAWGELDALIVDLPPGTGDVQLTLSQKADVTGAVIVSTPQDLALLDARKAIDMFRKLKTPILGIVENMASFCCPNCGTETAIFGLGGAKREAERLDIPFLGAIPLDLDLRMASDAGTPLSVTDPEGAQFQRFQVVKHGRRGDLVPGFGQGRGDLLERDAEDLVATEDLDVVGFQAVEERFRFLPGLSAAGT